MTRTTLPVRALLALAVIAALMLVPALASGAGQAPPTSTTTTSTTSTTIATTTTIETGVDDAGDATPTTVVDGDALPDAEAAAADAVAGQPTFTG